MTLIEPLTKKFFGNLYFRPTSRFQFLYFQRSFVIVCPTLIVLTLLSPPVSHYVINPLCIFSPIFSFVKASVIAPTFPCSSFLCFMVVPNFSLLPQTHSVFSGFAFWSIKIFVIHLACLSVLPASVVWNGHITFYRIYKWPLLLLSSWHINTLYLVTIQTLLEISNIFQVHTWPFLKIPSLVVLHSMNLV